MVKAADAAPVVTGDAAEGAADLPAAPAASLVAEDVAALFQEAQASASAHRKTAVALRKLQERCSRERAAAVRRTRAAAKNGRRRNVGGGGEDGEEKQEEGEDEEMLFNREFARNLNRVLPVARKREPAVERVLGFFASFVAYTRTKDDESCRSGASPAGGGDDGDVEDSVSIRFVEYLIAYYLQGLEAKDKGVRLKVARIIAICMQNLGAIDDSIYDDLRTKLAGRVRDKDAGVRVQVAAALSEMQADPVDGEQVTAELLSMLRTDPSAEVRRAVLSHVAITSMTRPLVLERAADVDPGVRRLVYQRCMAEMGDFRQLSIEEREKLLLRGLHDREPGIRELCANMVSGHWIPQANSNLVDFLKCLDVVSEEVSLGVITPDEPGKSVAEDALKAFFDHNPDFNRKLVFDDEYLNNLTSETAFLMRVYCEYCKESGDEAAFDDILPEVPVMAYQIQQYRNLLTAAQNDGGDDDRKMEAEFVVTQLLLLARLLDFADETGRRQIFQLLRNIVVLSGSPEIHQKIIVDIIKRLSRDGRDFVRIMCEVISDLREQSAAGVAEVSVRTSVGQRDQSPVIPVVDETQSPGLEEADAPARRLVAWYNCLFMAKCMLERSDQPLKENASTHDLLDDLIVPALECAASEPIRGLGLRCLGLCCVLDSDLARKYIDLFIHEATVGPLQSQVCMTKTIVDLVTHFGLDSLSYGLREPPAIFNLLLEGLGSEHADLQTAAGMGIAKLLFIGATRDEEMLRPVLSLYFRPHAVENQRLRQCLSYFLPTFAHCADENQEIMTRCFVPVMRELIDVFEGLDDVEAAYMLHPTQIAGLLIDWTDADRIVTTRATSTNHDPDLGRHANLAIDILKASYDLTVGNRRFFFQTLNKLRVNDKWGANRINIVLVLISSIRKACRPADSVSRKNLDRFEASVREHVSDPMGEDEMRQCAVYDGLFEFVERKAREQAESSIATRRPLRHNRLEGRNLAEPTFDSSDSDDFVQPSSRHANLAESSFDSSDSDEFVRSSSKTGASLDTPRKIEALRMARVARLEEEIDALLDDDDD